MFDRFTDRAKKIMAFSREQALRFHHNYIGTEHILLGLLREGSGVAANVLKNMELDLDEVRRETERLMQAGTSEVTQGQIPFTPPAKKVLELAMEEASDLSHDYIGSEHLVLGLIRENGGIAAQVLVVDQGAKLDQVREEILEFLGETDETEEPGMPGELPATRIEVWTHWYDSGHAQSRGCYKNRRREGPWTFWNEDGSIDEARTGRYEDGELVEERAD